MGTKKRTHEMDYFRDQRTKQLTSAPDIYSGDCREVQLLLAPFFPFILLFFGVIKISSVLSVKAVN